MSANVGNQNLLVQIASYNTNLQGTLGLPQDLVDWLSPTLQVSSFLTSSHGKQAPDIVAVGFQELLPLHLGLTGLSKKVIESRDTLIRSQIEAHSPNKDRYSLVAKVCNVGVALLVYVRDEALSGKVCDVQTQWTGCGPAWMGNKGAVGVRFRLAGPKSNDVGEIFTFVNAHLTAHAPKLANRIADFHHIVATLLFPPIPSSSSQALTTMYSTSHLFFLGDLNFRLELPATHPLAGPEAQTALVDALKKNVEREELKEHDQLLIQRRKGTVFVGFREGEFWQFQCTYKYHLKEVDSYSTKRTPSWTDRILYTTYSDSSDSPDKSAIRNVLYTSIPSYTTSDHKPIVAVLLVPTSILSSSSSTSSPPLLRLPSSYTPKPDPYWILKRHAGRACDRIIGVIWSLFWFIGFGNAVLGMGNFIFSLVAWSWAKKRSPQIDVAA
ncbi:inositol polyphosphate phosphatase [Rickenella mellea]|uniref:Inositol polyphosphate phosphatase n=1 Tax=Rickenella mellea TaxID=50990 RepID=A0A4Y7QDA3_9AGAM|nr:inositol polyphosphate phosphatase [Rickenella mellea]